MKNILIAIIMGIIVICSSLVITNDVVGGEYSYTTTPEALQSRIDYNQKIIWELEHRYNTTDCRRMSPKDAERYTVAKRDLKKAIAEYNYIINNRQYKTKGYYLKY